MKSKNNFHKLQEIRIYCKNCKNTQLRRFWKKLVLILKNKIKGKSKCATFLTERTFIDKIEDEYDLESKSKVYFQFFPDWYYKRTWRRIAQGVGEKNENLNSKIFKTKNGRLIMQSKVPTVELKNQDLSKNKKQNIYNACGPFTKSKERIETFMQTGNTDFIYRSDLDKAPFQHDMPYGKSRDSAKKIIQRDIAFKIAIDPKYDGYQRGLASMVSNFFYKEFSGSGVDAEPNYELANELYKLIIKKFKRRKVYSSFKDNMCGVDLADMQSLSKCNKRIKYLLCESDLFSKYAWVVF